MFPRCTPPKLQDTGPTPLPMCLDMFAILSKSFAVERSINFLVFFFYMFCHCDLRFSFGFVVGGGFFVRRPLGVEY